MLVLKNSFALKLPVLSEVGGGWLGILVCMDKLHLLEIYLWCRVVPEMINVLFNLLGHVITLSTSLLSTDLDSLPLVLVDTSLYHSGSTQ